MLELGWGTPTLLTLSLGVLLELPDPVRLAIIGIIDAGLPDRDIPLIELHIDVLGVVDFGAKTLAIDGTLFDSRVLVYALSGDLAMRLSWGNSLNFLFSLGGFNPHFNTAALDIPQLKRMSLSIGDGDNPRLSSNSYFAITSNTLQFGANNEAYASAGGFGIHGYLGFDVLIVYSPFSFEFDFNAHFDVTFEGHSLASLHVDGTFSGPTPWRLHAHASIDILWWSVGASFTIEWGDSTPAILPSRSVLGDLIPALQDARNWRADLSGGAALGVSLLSPKPGDNTLRVHPIGVLSVRETAFLSISPSRVTPTALHPMAASSGSVRCKSMLTPRAPEPSTDFFAAAQFLTLSDDDKLSRPSFEPYDAGVSIGSAGFVAGSDSPRTLVYDERYIDTPSGFSRFSRNYGLPAAIHASLTQQGAGYVSALKNTGLGKYSNPAGSTPIVSAEPSYVVATTDDLSIRSDIVSGAGAAFFQARSALATYLIQHPEEAGSLQILPAHDLPS